MLISENLILSVRPPRAAAEKLFRLLQDLALRCLFVHSMFEETIYPGLSVIDALDS